jgi:hypothetical protein
MKKGYVAITTVLILLLLIGTIGTTGLLLSIGEAQSGLSAFKGEDSLQFVEGCAEDALLKSRASATYAGGNITRPEGTCTVSVSKAGNVWTLTVSTLDTKFRKTIQIQIVRTGSITLNSWKEI